MGFGFLVVDLGCVFVFLLVFTVYYYRLSSVSFVIFVLYFALVVGLVWYFCWSWFGGWVLGFWPRLVCCDLLEMLGLVLGFLVVDLGCLFVFLLAFVVYYCRLSCIGFVACVVSCSSGGFGMLPFLELVWWLGFGVLAWAGLL